MKRIYYTVLFTIYIQALLKAQSGGNIGQLEISVTNRYKANVGEVIKFTKFPSFKDTTTNKLPVNYGIASRPVKIEHHTKPLKPARIAKVSVEKPYKRMIKGGFGFYTTPLLEAYYNSGSSSTYSYGFWGKHFSTKTGISDILYEDNGTSINDLGGYFNRFYSDIKWQTRVFGRFDKYSYYGLGEIPKVIDDNSRGKPSKNWYRQFSVKTGIAENKPKDLGILKQAWIEYYFLIDDFNFRENYLNINSSWNIPVSNFDLQLEAKFNFHRANFDSLTYEGFSIFYFRPHITTYIKDIILDVGFNFMTSYAPSRIRIYVYPEVKASYPFVQDVLTAYVGVRSRLKQNTLRHLTDENPYIISSQIFTSQIFTRPTSTYDIFIGLKGLITSTLSFNVKGGFKKIGNWAIYYRDPFYYKNTDDPGFLSVIYDNAKIFYSKGDLSANVNNRLQINLNGELRNISTKTLTEAWHVPSFTAGLHLRYIWNKIRLTPHLTYVGSRKAFDMDLNPLIKSKLNSYLRTDFKVEYFYNNRLSGFIDFYNLLNTPYKLYLGYPAQNINLIFGLTYKF